MLQLTNSELLIHVLVSFQRVAEALAIASLLGIPAGYYMAGKGLFSGILRHMVASVRYIPPTAYIGLLIVLLGIGPKVAIALMVAGIAPYIAVMSADVFKNIPAQYFQVAAVYGVPRRQHFFKVVLPYTLPRVIDVVKVNVGAAWTFLVVAEMIAGREGIGFLIGRAQRFSDIEYMVLLIAISGLCGMAMDQLLGFLSRHYGRWADNA